MGQVAIRKIGLVLGIAGALVGGGDDHPLGSDDTFNLVPNAPTGALAKCP